MRLNILRLLLTNKTLRELFVIILQTLGYGLMLPTTKVITGFCLECNYFVM